MAAQLCSELCICSLAGGGADSVALRDTLDNTKIKTIILYLFKTDKYFSIYYITFILKNSRLLSKC